MVAPDFKVRLTVAGGLARFDLSCCALITEPENKVRLNKNIRDNCFILSIYSEVTD